MFNIYLAVCVLGVVSAVPHTHRHAKSCGYESCTKADPGKLNVHIVPHTHDDVGWLKTVDQYYYGSRNDIQKAGVQYILDSVVKELWEDPRRRFIYVETAFFWKWWVRQSKSTQSKVHTLVNEGRLRFVGGAWSMNDEAAVHYQSTIDQFTWGLKKLNETFGECGIPRVGWQIDPFGHSRELASLLAGMGYDGLFLGRIDYQDKGERKSKKSMEMIWRGDDVLGKQSDLFTGVLYNTYSPPPGFCFDVLCNDEPIIDDADSPMNNVERRINDFISYVTKQSQFYRTNNVIVTMGGDFTYQDANMWYKNLDKLIHYTNLKAAKDGFNITLFYSTPDCYLKAVKDADPILPTKQDDFFPYASDPTAYWTGYFTSRPTTKYFEREGNNYLQVAKQLQVLANLEKHNMIVLNELKSAMGVMQHHDAVTGTEKQHVTHDYVRILDQAVEDSLLIPRQAINKITQCDALKPPILDMNRCKLNESSCETSEKNHNFIVTLYNPLAWKVKEPIRIPVILNNCNDYEVYCPMGEKIPSQIVDIPSAVKRIPSRVSQATHEIVIRPTLPPLGYKSFYMKKIVKCKSDLKRTKSKRDLKRINNIKDYYNINNYWKNLKEKSLVEIKNIDRSNIKNVYTGELIDDYTNTHDTNLNEEKDLSFDIENANLNVDRTELNKESDVNPDYLNLNTKDFANEESEMKETKSRKIDKEDSNLNIGNKESMLNDKAKVHSKYDNLNGNKKGSDSFENPIDLNLEGKKARTVIGDENLNLYTKDSVSFGNPIDVTFGKDNIKAKTFIETPNLNIYAKDVTFLDKDILVEPNLDNFGKFDVLRDRVSNRDVVEFEKLLKEESKKEGDREGKRYSWNDEEMRMLSDDPRVVEMYLDMSQKPQIKYNYEKKQVVFDDLPISADFYYYPGCVGNNENYSNRSSGAYIFRPNSTAPTKVNLDYDGKVSGDIVKEIRMKSDNLGGCVKIYDDFVDFDLIIGPININDNIGKEYVIKYETNLINNGEFYTDSNSRQMLKRKLNTRPEWNVSLSEPVAGNYYPVTSMIAIDDKKMKILAVLTDRSEGGSSLVEGQVELMLHRRLLHDDAFGVGEALNEMENGLGLVTRVNHRVIAKNLNNINVNLRKFMINYNLRPTVYISKAIEYDKWIKLNNEKSFLKNELSNIHILTLEPWGDKLLLRLENINELPGCTTVDLNNIFNNIKIKDVKETTLAANQWVNDHKKWSWRTENSFYKDFNKAYGTFEIEISNDEDYGNNDVGMKIKLKSKEIRTFIVDYEFNK